MEKLEEIHKEILNRNMDILKDFPLLYCFIEKVKDYTVHKLLKLKNDLWIEEDEKEVTKKDFKDRMKFISLYVFSESANFYFDDSNPFWEHTIEVTVNQNLKFVDANIVG